ncbi:hypothetical protein OV320_7840 [Actinobacteria bacterium OV320]|nr:hypothetical protein OV320_7840 [Actinobacteria bacterium OV320]
MRFRITAKMSRGKQEWEESLGIHEEIDRRGLTKAIHALHLENQWAVMFHARELSTGEVLAYRMNGAGWFEPVGQVFGGAFRGFEKGNA